ncbi:MAG: hypothetical protein PHV16_02625 [Candidatus Nanoarchaeia archaeon]|nr:hypothetical protein [Candidatus Nanoarchaeia archaeon]
MKIINVKINKIKVSSFSARDYSVHLEIDFNDGSNKQIMRHTLVDYPEMVVEHIFNDLKKMEKNINMKFNGQGMFDNSVNIIMQNQENDKKKIIKFLSAVKEKVEKIKGKKSVEGYMDIIKELNMLKVEL